MLESIYKKGGNFKYSEVFQCGNGGEFKGEVTTLLFEGQQQNTNIFIRPL